MAPSMVASRSSTPGASKGKVADRTVKENAQGNSTVKSGLVEKKVVTPAKVAATATASWRQRVWRTAAMVAVAGALVTAGVAATPKFDPSSARDFFGKTPLLLGKLASIFGQAIDGLFNLDAPSYCRRVLEVGCSEAAKVAYNLNATGHFQRAVDYVESAGYFQSSISRSILLALGGAPVALLGVWMCLRLATKVQRGVSALVKKGKGVKESEKA